MCVWGGGQASLAGILWATGDKAGAQKMADAVGGKDVLATFVQAQQVRRVEWRGRWMETRLG